LLCLLYRMLETTATLQNEGSSMFFRLSSWWYSLQDTLWFIPGLMTAGAVVLSFVMLQLDRTVLPAHRLHNWWLFEGGAEGARGVLSAIAGTMMTVATTAFSITIVAVQLGSSQFSPRILRGFTGDRGNQLVLGTFIASFAYSLLILRSVRSATSDGQIFVPSASVSLAIVLALVSIGSLIYFFHHATRGIQASVIIERAANDTFGLIKQAIDTGAEQTGAAPNLPSSRLMTEVRADRSGYVIGRNTDALYRLAEKFSGLLVVHVAIGDYLFTGTKLASMFATPDTDAKTRDHHHSSDDRDDHDNIEQKVRSAFTIDMERSLEQDVRLGFRQLADIAVKALSPGINDPTTATICIDRLGEALVRSREISNGFQSRSNDDGHSRLRWPQPGFEAFLGTSVRQIRHFGAGDATVMAHLLDMLGVVADGADPAIRFHIETEANATLEEAMLAIEIPIDRARVRSAAEWITQS